MANQPRSREKNVTGNSKGVQKRGSGLGTGPVGNRPVGSGSSGGRGVSGGTRAGGRTSPIGIIIALVVLLLGGGGGALFGLSGGDSSAQPSAAQTPAAYTETAQPTAATGISTGAVNPFAGILMNGQGTGSTWQQDSNTGRLNTDVAPGSRDKYTLLKGDGTDTTTIMVYMCGTDLESRSGMATNDLKEMAAATLGNNLNLIVYTGGCSSWKISQISSRVNQIYQVKDGKLILLEENMGSKPMTDPNTLSEFIRYCNQNYPALRNDLIFWDHGGGSISGYGYDENYKNSGSMNLTGINKALHDGGLRFDFIGFDACLMATAETALMLNEYADYMIASEETEPGIGWYYTDWLTAYGKNPSMPTLNIGKNIVDGFIDECARKCRGQNTTLSVIDLAEFSNTVPEKLSAFSVDTAQMIENKQYQEIATARQSSREFAQSSRIDQCDLVDLAKRMNTEASNALAEALLSAVKYNRTSSTMTNAYGVSIYFPNRKLSSVDNAVSINNAIGMNDEYSRCIKEYAALQVAGQTVAAGNGNTGSPYGSLTGSYSGSVPAGSSLTAQLLQSLLTGGSSNLSSLSGGSSSFLSGRSMSDEDTVSYITDHQFDTSKLVWQKDSDGSLGMTLPADQWSLVTGLDLNMFYDDGEGYIDLGCDNLFTIDDAGTLHPETDRTWLAINGQPVAYYHLTTVDDGENYTISGYVPAMLNGTRIRLYLNFDQDNPYGYIAGYSLDYHDGETETAAKAEAELQIGDTLEFLCDYYSYDGTYLDTYYLGEPMEVTEEMTISNVSVGDGPVCITYRFTDIYGNEYWTPVCE